MDDSPSIHFLKWNKNIFHNFFSNKSSKFLPEDKIYLDGYKNWNMCLKIVDPYLKTGSLYCLNKYQSATEKYIICIKTFYLFIVVLFHWLRNLQISPKNSKKYSSKTFTSEWIDSKRKTQMSFAGIKINRTTMNW